MCGTMVHAMARGPCRMLVLALSWRMLRRHAASCTRGGLCQAVDRAGAAAAQAQRRQHAAAARQDAQAQGGAGLAGRRLRGESLRLPCRTSAWPRSMRRPTTCWPSSMRWARRMPSGEPDCAKLQELTRHAAWSCRQPSKPRLPIRWPSSTRCWAGPTGAPAEAKQPKTAEAAQGPRPKLPRRSRRQPPRRRPPRPSARARAGTTRDQRRPLARGGDRAAAPAVRAPAAASAARRSRVPRRTATPSTRSWRRAPASSARSRPISAPSSSISSRTAAGPRGYVLGTEGGGAFLAGVRYGSGTLYMRAAGTQHAEHLLARAVDRHRFRRRRLQDAVPDLPDEVARAALRGLHAASTGRPISWAASAPPSSPTAA